MSDLFSDTHGGKVVNTPRIGSDHAPRARAYRASQRRQVQPGDGLWASSVRKGFYTRHNLRPGDLVEYRGQVGELSYISASRDGTSLTLVLYRTGLPSSDVVRELKEKDMKLGYRGLDLAVNCTFLERKVMTKDDRRRQEAGRSYYPY